ncbi:hypothetical protein Vi05172_g7474 [Venturia inaequalis]|nr:hypothetical protein Vi05172_g7474 [Venturia inaequalis]
MANIDDRLLQNFIRWGHVPLAGSAQGSAISNLSSGNSGRGPGAMIQGPHGWVTTYRSITARRPVPAHESDAES